MGNKAHIKIDKVVEYCSECPFCSIKCTGYGKSGCYEYELSCSVNDKTIKPITYTNLRYGEIFVMGDEDGENLDKAKDFVPNDCPFIKTL